MKKSQEIILVIFIVFHVITAGLFLKTKLGNPENWPLLKIKK